MKETRKALEEQGWIFHQGHETSDGRFASPELPHDTCPSYIGDLKAMGWIPVKGGMLEPPRIPIKHQIASLVIIGSLAYLGYKIFIEKPASPSIERDL